MDKEKERKSFEEWYTGIKNGTLHKYTNGQYKNKLARVYWREWKERPFSNKQSVERLFGICNFSMSVKE